MKKSKKRKPVHAKPKPRKLSEDTLTRGYEKATAVLMAKYPHRDHDWIHDRAAEGVMTAQKTWRPDLCEFDTWAASKAKWAAMRPDSRRRNPAKEMFHARMSSIDAPVEGSDLSVAHLLAGKQRSHVSPMETAAFLGQLNPHERMVLKMRAYRLTMWEAGDVLEVTEGRISQILHDVIEKFNSTKIRYNSCAYSNRIH